MLKRVVIANLGISLMGILRRKNVLAIVLSLFIIGTAFLLIVQYEKGMEILQNKWQPRYDIRRKDSFLGRSPVIKDKPNNLTRYSIKADLKADLNEKENGLEIRFCDKYSLIITGSNLPSGVYYYKADNSMKEYVSEISYKDVIARKKIVSPRLKKINVYLKCDLIEKIADIYIDGKFIEKVYLGSEARHYAVNLNLNLRNFILYNVEIYDRVGKILFSANYEILFLYKLISEILIFFGVLIFLVLACSEKCFFKKFLYFIVILLVIEVLLRISEKNNQNFNTSQLKPKWQFEISTNFYGTYDNPKEIAIRSYNSQFIKTYPIVKPEDSKRIICIGGSTLAGAGLTYPIDEVFPNLLEKKINPAGEVRNRVININFREIYINSPEPNIFLKEVLFKLNPDLVIFYGDWTPPWIENSKKYIEENYILYNRAKKAIEENSSWIKNDRLLYAALEFKKPIKEIVYLYDLLCNSYLFMGLENTRKRLFNRLHYIGQESSVEKPVSYFDKTIRLCKEKKIKLLLIPTFIFFTSQSNLTAEKEIARILDENPEIYYLDLEEAFRRNENSILTCDGSHPSGYGHKIIAEEIFHKLMEMGLFDTNEGL